MTEDNNFWKEIPKAQVSSKLPDSPTSNYKEPNLIKVLTDIKFDDEYFIPKYSNNGTRAEIHANIANEAATITPHGILVVDCGFSIKIMEGYRACFCLDSSLSSLVISGSNHIEPNEECRVKITVVNVGEKIIIRNKQIIGKIWIEPVYFFDWK
jgi:dUTPase